MNYTYRGHFELATLTDLHLARGCRCIGAMHEGNNTVLFLEAGTPIDDDLLEILIGGVPDVNPPVPSS